MLAVRTFAAKLPIAQASVAARFTNITFSSFMASVSEASHPQRKEALLVELLAELYGVRGSPVGSIPSAMQLHH